MRRIMIPTITQPGVPNANGLIYSKSVWDDFIREITHGGYIKIPVTIEQNVEWSRSGSVPSDKIIGYASIISDKYIIVDLVDYETALDRSLSIAFIDCIIDHIHRGGIKAYMNYLVDIDAEPGMAFKYVDKIYRIDYFHLGHADSYDSSPLEFKTEELSRYIKKHKRYKK